MKLLESLAVYPVYSRPLMSCHASSLCAAENGDILTVFFAGTGEKRSDVEIYLSRLSGGKWSAPVMMSEKSDICCWNPVLYADKNDITLFFKRGREITEWRTFVRRSHDGGLTWSREALLCGDESDRGPVKNKPIRLSNGYIVAGSSHESPDGSRWDAFSDVSRDGGLTWHRSCFIGSEPYARVIQPTLWEDGGGLHMLLRSAEGYIYRADSLDCGQSWTRCYPTSLPSNNSGIDLTSLPDRRLALCCNPVPANWGKRSPLTVALSSDGFETIYETLILAEGEGEYSYPAVIYADGFLHVTFTYRRKTIMYCKVGF